MYFLAPRNLNRRLIVLGKSKDVTYAKFYMYNAYPYFSHVKTHAEIVQAATERVKEENESKDRKRAISLDRR